MLWSIGEIFLHALLFSSLSPLEEVISVDSVDYYIGVSNKKMYQIHGRESRLEDSMAK